MSNCVYIDLGDGDFIKPNFSKPPTPEMIAEAKAWGLKMKAEDKAIEASGACMDCRGKGTRRQRDLDAPSFKLVDKACPQCNGTGRTPKSPAPSACPECGGSGKIGGIKQGLAPVKENIKYYVCPACHGTGKAEKEGV